MKPSSATLKTALQAENMTGSNSPNPEISYKELCASDLQSTKSSKFHVGLIPFTVIGMPQFVGYLAEKYKFN